VATRTVKFADIDVSAQSGRRGRRYPQVVTSEQPGDPFEGVRLDDAFVRDASRREASAEVRATRARAARLAHDVAHAMVAEQRRTARRAARRARWRRRSVVLVAVALVALAVTQVRGGGEEGGLTWLSGGFVQVGSGDDRPTAARRSGERLLPLPPLPPEEGSHAFLHTQRGGADPIAYDPCRPISYLVNDRTAPPGAVALVAEAFEDVSKYTGLVFEYEGLTDEKPVEDRAPFLEDLYGDRWAPVLVAWSDEVELPRLADRVLGIGGSTAATGIGTSAYAYVTGSVALDGPDMARLLHREGWASARAVVEHELGHLVGLDHVRSTGELMNGTTQIRVTGFQAGDQVGLQRLGAGRCFDRL
jgi:hypothetical protein